MAWRFRNANWGDSSESIGKKNLHQKKPNVRNSAPRFHGRKWLRQFYERLGFWGSFCWKISILPLKVLVLGGGPRFRGVFFLGGGAANSIFMGAGILQNLKPHIS